MGNDTRKEKAVYVGIDALFDCLKLLETRGYDIVYIYTMQDDSYDRTIQIQNYAKEHGIPCNTERMTKQDLLGLEQMDVNLMVIAGYGWKLPISEKIRQVNIHPAYLPVGRGSWPLPVAILKGEDSGVTLHKLSERMDEGDILLRQQIPIEEQDHLELLMDKVRSVAERLLGQFLDDPDERWNHACSQEEGEYWPEPDDGERTFSLWEDSQRISTILRAFYGYGSLCMIHGIPIEITKGAVVAARKQTDEAKLQIRLADGNYLLCQEWRPAFRKIQLADKDVMENIRRKYRPLLSDYTFALLYCWQEALQLSVYIGEDIYVVKGRDDYFFPIGEAQKVKEFIDGLARLGITPKFRFCDERMLAWVQETYGEKSSYMEAPDDSDYVVENALIRDLAGRKYASRRKDYAHYCRALPEPETIRITKDNAGYLRMISDCFAGADQCPEDLAIEHFFELDLIGILVKKGEKYVGFALCSAKDEQTLQGHFMKCIDPERGSKFYLLKACIDAFSDQYSYTNMEDDMGSEGLRRFKSSFGAQQVSSYTIELRKDANE